MTIIRDGGPDQSGVACVPDLASLPHQLDLLVVAIGAAQVPDLVEDVIARDAAQAVMLIPGGMGETEDSRARALQAVACINAAHGQGDGIARSFWGPTAWAWLSSARPLRHLVHPRGKLPRDRDKPWRRAALVSQSGAFMLHRSQCPSWNRPATTTGNQTDLTLGDMVPL